MVAAVLAAGIVSVPSASAQPCVFDQHGPRWALAADCSTDRTIELPDGVQLDGQGHRITAFDPATGPFRGAILSAHDGTLSIENVIVETSQLRSACLAGADRLAGIRLARSSAVLAHVVVRDVARGGGRCDEGVAIESIGYAGGPAPTLERVVQIRRSTMMGFQKGGVVAAGRQLLILEESRIDASAAQSRVPANGVQIGLGTRARVRGNVIAGNSWCCADAAATAILLVDAARGTRVSDNRIVGGNADVGIFVVADHVLVDDNVLVDEGADGGHDVGILNLGAGNLMRGNLILGFEHPYEGPAESLMASGARKAAAAVGTGDRAPGSGATTSTADRAGAAPR